MVSLAVGRPASVAAEPATTNPVPVVAAPSKPAVVPYRWRSVAIGGGGFVTGLLFHPAQKDLLYARTDVGGAYRWEAAARRWMPITDWIGSEDVNLTGIESLAVDPSDSNRVYLAAGTYSRNRAAILRSADQGRTFARTDVRFTMGANETGRFNGERLAVDPHQGEILFFGSRHDGLWKSSDRGATWRKVEGFPDVASDSGSAGIVCVVFDASAGRPGQPTPILYAAVSTTRTNLFRTRDGGAGWEAVPNQPLGLRPNHVVQGPGGLLYLTYGKEPGPNSMSDGAVWKYDARTESWTDVTPARVEPGKRGFGYGAIAVDAQHPSTIMVTTFAHWEPHDEIFRSTNSGVSWMPMLEHAKWDHSNAPYTRDLKPHWMGDIKINPFNPDQVVFTTGYGIWSCGNATQADSGRASRWVFLDEGLEETVPLTLLSPPEGVHLLSGVGDIDGFRHDDLAVSPAGAFDGPRYGNTEDLAFAGRKPQVFARTGTTRARGRVRAAVSTNGGRSWKAFDSEPTNSMGAGSIAVSADGRIFVWTPRRSAPCFSADQGSNWTACAGLTSGLRVVADSVNPARFYAYDSRAGKLFASTNGAAGFEPVGGAFPVSESFPGGFGGGGGQGVRLYATPDREGDLWLSFRTAGLFHSIDGGAHFTPVEHVEQANSLGFGKPAQNPGFPALYLAGRIQEVTGLFRSDDAGQRWVRINDDQHQFGWINHVTGDPRIYGRVYFGTGGRGILYGDPAPAADQARGR
jgi:photosystem II stability/assembly factor-like uncharacterized protein